METTAKAAPQCRPGAAPGTGLPAEAARCATVFPDPGRPVRVREPEQLAGRLGGGLPLAGRSGAVTAERLIRAGPDCVDCRVEMSPRARAPTLRAVPHHLGRQGIADLAARNCRRTAPGGPP